MILKDIASFKNRFKITLTITLQLIGWSIYWLFLTFINVKYYSAKNWSIPLLLLWATIFTLCGMFLFFLLTRIYDLLLKKKMGYIPLFFFTIVLSFIGAYIWGLFETIISWVINPWIDNMNIAWDINSRGTFSLTFIVAFFSILYYFSKIMEQSNVQENVLTVKYEIKQDLNTTITVYFKNNIVLLPLKNIKKISIDGNYSRILDNKNMKYELKQSLKNWETELPENCFIRIHRSTIINKNYIEKIEPWHNYTYKIYLNNSDEPEDVSRRYAAIIKKSLNL